MTDDMTRTLKNKMKSMPEGMSPDRILVTKKGTTSVLGSQYQEKQLKPSKWDDYTDYICNGDGKYDKAVFTPLPKPSTSHHSAS